MSNLAVVELRSEVGRSEWAAGCGAELPASWMLSGKPASEKRVQIFMEITPDLAKRWMEEANTKNRPLRRNHYRAIARDLKAARWVEIGDTVRFDRNGVMLDAQHRCYAVMEAETPILATVIFGLNPKAIEYIDVAIKIRPARDIGALNGIANAGQVGSVARLLLRYWHGYFAPGKRFSGEPTKHEVTQAMLTNPRIEDVVRRCQAWRRHHILSDTVNGACYYLFSEQNERLAESFFEGLKSGIGLREFDPVRLLEKRLTQNAADKSKLPQMEILALYFKAWICYRSGQALRNLRWQGDREAFPDIRG